MERLFKKASSLLNLELQGGICPDFGSDRGRHRLLIRKALRRAIRRKTGKDFPESMNLLKPPLRFEGLFISLSHAKGMGGFVLSSAAAIGFDIEETARFKKYWRQSSGSSRQKPRLRAAAKTKIQTKNRKAQRNHFLSGKTPAVPPAAKADAKKSLKKFQKKILCSKEESSIEIARLWCLKEAAAKALFALEERGREKAAGKPFMKDVFVRETGPKKMKREKAGLEETEKEETEREKIEQEESKWKKFHISFKGKICGEGAAFQDSAFTAAFVQFKPRRSRRL